MSDEADKIAILPVVEEFLMEAGMSASRFGREVLGDPTLVYEMRGGRVLRQKTEQRVLTFILSQSEKTS